MSQPAVLHILPALGGGVDRHVRDLVAAVDRRQLLWHVGERAEVMETAGEPRFLPLDRARVDADTTVLADWLRGNGVGLTHLHGVGSALRRRAEQLAQRLELPLVVTLHDVQFLRPDAFAFTEPAPEPSWIAELDPVLRGARAVLAPSEYIAQRARDAYPGLAVEVVPNGIAPPPPPHAEVAARGAFLARERPAHVVAVLGAIGPHKGADLLRALPAHLEGSGIGLVMIGYLDQQIRAGWNEETGAFLHGPYDPRQTGDLLRAYGAELVLFPNHVPESFSYTLSEAWAEGYPVVAAPTGAIGERVRRHEGGWLLPEGFGPAEVARELRRLCSPEGAAEVARVKSRLASPDAQRVPTLTAMAETIDAYYRRYGRTAEPAPRDAASGPAAPRDAASGPAIDDPQAVQSLIATSLDSTLFRKELAHLADLCDDDGLTNNRLRKSEAEARDWIAKLEGDLAAVQAEAARVWEERCRIDLERDRLAVELEQVRAAGAFGARLHPFVRRVLAKLLNARS